MSDELKKEEQIEPQKLAGAIPADGADNPMETDTPKCNHEYKIDRTLLHKKNIWGNTETLAAVVFCSKCGRLGGSSRLEA